MKGKENPAGMNIQKNHPLRKESEIICPHCHSKDVWKHGTYYRKWFHSWGSDRTTTRKVQRYRCCEKPCPCKTFTVQAEDVLPYCRFLIPHLCSLQPCLDSAKSLHHLSRLLDLSRSVIKRVRAFLQRIEIFLSGLCLEISDGETIASTSRQCLQIALTAYSWIKLKSMWFCYQYRHWHPAQNGPHKIRSLL